jgi:cyanophycin synthetase
MQFRKVLALRGPNYWANFPVLEAWVDLGQWKDISSEMMPGFNDRLMSWLPTMIEHRCSVGTRGGFFERLRRGTYLAHILEHVTLELQSLAGTEVGFGRARETAEEGVYKVAIEYTEETLARACLEKGRELVMAAVHGHNFDVAAEVQKLKELAYDCCLGPSTAAIVNAAVARGIPHRRLNSGSLVVLGYGHKQRRILAAETDRTGAIAESIAQDKDLTRALLSSVGVPVPEGRPVTDAEDAWEAAQEIDAPVVVKPQFGNHGRGVATNLSTREQVVAAFEAARKEGKEVIVEKYAPGYDHRLLVVGNKVVAAARREPPKVVGDGVSTVAQLVAEVNKDPRRSDGHGTVLSYVKIDEIARAVLAEQGLTPDSVPSAGQEVLIRRNANLSTGATAIDVTDEVHPSVAEQAVDAARVIGLDIAGVDIICQDIRQPLNEQGACGARIADAPAAGSGQAATGRREDCRSHVSARRERPHSDCGRHGRQR